jgi:hypothetical protein
VHVAATTNPLNMSSSHNSVLIHSSRPHSVRSPQSGRTGSISIFSASLPYQNALQALQQHKEKIKISGKHKVKSVAAEEETLDSDGEQNSGAVEPVELVSSSQLTFDEAKLQYDSELYSLNEAINAAENKIKKADYRLKLMSQWKMEKLESKASEQANPEAPNEAKALAAAKSEAIRSSNPFVVYSASSNMMTERTKIRKLKLLLRAGIVRHFLRLAKVRKLLKIIHKQFFDMVGSYLNLEWDSTIENNVRVQSEIDSWYNSAKILRSKLIDNPDPSNNDIAWNLANSLRDIGEIMKMLVEELQNRQNICRQVYTSFYNRNKQIQAGTHQIQLNYEQKKKSIHNLQQQLSQLQQQHNDLTVDYSTLSSNITFHALNERKLNAKLHAQLRSEDRIRADERRNTAVAADIQRRLQLKALIEKKNREKQAALAKKVVDYNKLIIEKAKVHQQQYTNTFSRDNQGANSANHSANKSKTLPYMFKLNKTTGIVEEIPLPQLKIDKSSDEQDSLADNNHGNIGAESERSYRPMTADGAVNTKNAALEELLELMNRPLTSARTTRKEGKIGGISASRRDKFVEKLKKSPLVEQSAVDPQQLSCRTSKLIIRPPTASAAR